MKDRNPDYLHGTHPREQKRLSRLNALLNANSLRAIGAGTGERILDVGSGLGQFSRMLARAVGSSGAVIGVEHDKDQLAEAHRQARDDGEEQLVDFREGDVFDLPLEDHEWGTFDVAHARFILEHVTDPLAVVRSMARAVRSGGRVVLEDDDHEVLRLVPEPAHVLDIWRAYYLTYERQGKDPFVGRNLITLLHEAGLRPQANDCLFFGSTSGSPDFDAMVDNFIHIIDGARKAITSFDLADDEQIDRALRAFEEWRGQPDAAMWYTTSWAEGVRPGAAAAPGRAKAGDSRAPVTASPAPVAADRTSLLRFLMDAAAELNSSLALEEVFHKIALGVGPLIEYHLFCVQLWNEETQLLEHSFSMKYGKPIPQKGGFPLGYGICGSCAVTRRAIRVGNVLEDPRYVRFRHPEVEIHSELAVPLVFKDRLIGVLDLESTEFDYFTEEHEQTVSALAAHMATALVNARLFEQVQRDEQRLDRDLATARRTQLRLLPKSNPSIAGLEIGAAYSAARELGGDFYDFLPDGDGGLAIAVGDVAGKATPAALLAAMTVGLIRACVIEHRGEPAKLLARLNGHLDSSSRSNDFVAMIFGVYDPEAATFKLVNSGLPRPFLARGDRMEEIVVEGMPLGLFPGTSYEEKTLTLQGGETVVLCSDGLMEDENPGGEAFGAAGIRSALGDLLPLPAQEIADGLIRAVREFSGDPALQHDDHTVVVLKFR